MLNINFKFFNSQKAHLAWDHVVWSIACKNPPKVWPVGEFLKKGICTASKFFAYISPICREAGLVQIYMKSCMRGHTEDVINRAKFYLNQIRGFDAVKGQIFGFPIGKRSLR